MSQSELLLDGHAPEEAYAEARAQFSEEDPARLTITQVNSWTHIAIAFSA